MIGDNLTFCMPLAYLSGFVIHSAYDLVFKHDAFGIVHHKPLIGKVRVCKHLEMITVANLFLCIDVNPDCFHRSRANFRRPQWGSLRDGLNSRTWPRFNAFMTPIRADIVGPRSSTTNINAAIAACHSGSAASFFGSPVM
jgi:hypothetical protein